ALRAEHLLALLMLDIDRFKQYNDRYGHAVGDQVLTAVATALKQAVRVYDVPTRYGGDEFAVILPDADTEAATRGANRNLEQTADAVSRRSAAARDRGSAIEHPGRARVGMERGRGRSRGSDPDRRAAAAEPRCGRCDLESDGLRGLSGVQQPRRSRGHAETS